MRCGWLEGGEELSTPLYVVSEPQGQAAEAGLIAGRYNESSRGAGEHGLVRARERVVEGTLGGRGAAMSQPRCRTGIQSPRDRLWQPSMEFCGVAGRNMYVCWRGWLRAVELSTLLED